MKNTEAIKILKYMKNYYNNKELDKYDGFELDDNEAIDKAIKLLEQKEIMSNADKMCAFVQLQREIHNFIEVMKDIDIKVDVQTKGMVIKWQ